MEPTGGKRVTEGNTFRQYFETIGFAVRAHLANSTTERISHWNRSRAAGEIRERQQVYRRRRRRDAC